MLEELEKKDMGQFADAAGVVDGNSGIELDLDGLT
jgi:hypothetical protein